MAKETATPGFHPESSNPFFNYSGQATEALKELWGWQVKAGQTVMDQSLKMGQTWTDYVHGQAQESAKLSQDYLKQGLGLAEEIRKSFFHLTEKVTKAQ